jgi:mannose-6-phosphate isomerase-like protein (cupin superfamily)
MTIQHLELIFAATRFTPETRLFYRSGDPAGKVSEARATVGKRTTTKQADADIYELAFRYRQKRVSSAVLRVGNTIYEDSDGDGRLEIRDGEVLAQRPLATEVMVPSPALNRALSLERLHDMEPNRSGKSALQNAFTASCGAQATEVHVLRSHSMLWVSVPKKSPPNKVHRHLGGEVYWVFTRGQGLFHRIHLKHGFETIAIEIKDNNPFHLISSADHMWYQPINTGDGPLEYLMAHEPSYEAAEELELAKEDSAPEWGFRFE